MLDILFLAAAGYGFYLGFSQGIINSFFRVLSMVIALMSAFKFGPLMTEMLQKGFDSANPLMFIFGFIATFFLTLWGVRLVGSMITEFMEGTSLNFPNQIIGGSVLALFFAFLYSVLIWFGEGAHLLKPELKNESRTYPYLQPLRETTFRFLGNVKPIVQNFLSETDKVMNQVEENRQRRTETKTDIYDFDDPNRPTNSPNSTTQNYPQ